MSVSGRLMILMILGFIALSYDNLVDAQTTPAAAAGAAAPADTTTLAADADAEAEEDFGNKVMTMELIPCALALLVSMMWN